MTDFTLEHPFLSNFQISITLELWRVESWTFHGLIISTLSTNSEKMNKIWEATVSTSRNIERFDMEWPNRYTMQSYMGGNITNINNIQSLSGWDIQQTQI